MASNLLGTVVYLPYLGLRDRARVADWLLVPASDLQERDLSLPALKPLCDGLARLYGEDASGAWGGPREVIGSDFVVADMQRLRRAVVVGVLADNPFRFTDFAVDDDGTAMDDAPGNEAWVTHTADQAQTWGHPLHSDGYVAFSHGGMATVTVGGYNVLDDDSPTVPPPRDLHQGILRRPLDDEYATAVYDYLGTEDDAARRLGRAIDWLELAWQNADVISDDLRIAALHAGFEALFGRPADTDATRGLLSDLLDDAAAPKTKRPAWMNRKGVARLDEITDLEWWFVQFAQLRNATLHGDEISDQDRVDDQNRPHKWVAEETLRAAIRETVAKAGNEHLRLTPLARALREAIRRSELASGEHDA